MVILLHIPVMPSKNLHRQLQTKERKMTLGEKIKQLRTEAELTQPELAVNAGIEQSYLSKLENEKASPSFDIISKIAQALDTEAMAVINSLDATYVKEKLSHLPEVAARYAEERMKRKQANFRRYVLAASLIVFGICSVLAGSSKVIFPDKAYNYESDGVINKGEPIELYVSYRLPGETMEQSKTRLQSVLARRDKKTLVSYEYKGEEYVETSGDQRRLFEKGRMVTIERRENKVLAILGMFMLCVGAFVFGAKKPFANKE